jgi:SPP1 gp7 family putative phage head morphogenesis protein
MNPLLLALVQAGIVTQADAERINRSMDPAAARAWAEQQLAIATQQGLSAQQARLVDMVRRTNGSLSPAALDEFWRAEDDRLWQAVRPAWEEIAAERAIGAAVRMGADDAMWRTINQAVINWTNTYYTSAAPDFVGSIPNLNQTSRAQVADAFARWNRGELNDGRQGGLPALVQELGQTFDPVRAERIAVTEVTRIFSESENAAAAVEPDIEIAQWDTAFDDIVCPICMPLDGMQVEKGREFAPGLRLPPAHPNCRCGVTFLTRPGAG